MSDKFGDARDLFLQLLAQMLWVERMLAFEVLPQLHRQVESESLAALIQDHLAQTHEHVARIEGIFPELGAEAASARSSPVAAAKDQHGEVAAMIADPRLADLFHAGAAMQTEHLELAGYALLLELAAELDRDEVTRALEANRDDEAKTLEDLSAMSSQLRGRLK